MASGLTIGYRRVGSGDALVLLHGGFGFDSRVWRPQLDALSDEFTVVAWDAPGCGRSDDPPDRFRMADYADCLAEFMTAKGVRRPAVLGLSFGGALALALYQRHPSLPCGLILADAYAGWAGSLPTQEIRERLDRITRELDHPPEEWQPAYIDGMFSDDAPAELARRALSLASDVRPRGALTMLRAMADADLRDVLDTIDVPTLVLHGDCDTRSPLAVGQALHQRIAGSRLVVLRGVGHLSNLQAPDAFNHEVRKFLHELNQ